MASQTNGKRHILTVLSRKIWPPALWIVGWLVLVLTALATRPLLPMDETRYVSVAWEMWLGGDFLVPHLNGEPYSHKPPLLFWLINLGWAVFGVSDWWARMVSPLFALGSLALMPALARLLWPGQRQTRELGELAPLVLLGGIYWSAFATLTMFDMMTCFFTLSALCGVLLAYTKGDRRGWMLAGLSLGLGILAKGPVILLHVLPVALLAPAWSGGKRPPRTSWLRWYAGLASALALAAAVALAWALPAARAGGEDYGAAILWGQTVGRMSESFAHQRGWWFYLNLLPLLLFPWILWPPVWRGLTRGDGPLSTPGGRFCLLWFVATFLALSMVSAKQPHYLIPSLPALALLFAAALGKAEGETCRHDRIPNTAILAAAALAMAALVAAPMIPAITGLPPWSQHLSALGLVIAVMAVVLAAAPIRELAWRTCALAGAGCLLLVAVHVTARPYLLQAFDLRPMARHIARLQDQGFLVANVHKYHGQYHFLGRLEKPLAITWQHEARQWAESNPGAKMIVSHRRLPQDVTPQFVQRLRGRFIAVWNADDVINNNNIVVP